MKHNIGVLIGVTLFFSITGHAEVTEMSQLPEGKAIRLEIETRQTILDDYYRYYTDRSKAHSKALFKNSYLSDGERFRVELHTLFQGAKDEQDSVTIAYDGDLQYILENPHGVLRIVRGPLNLKTQSGEMRQSPYQPFYIRNPLITMFAWGIRSFNNEQDLLSFNALAKSATIIDQLINKPSLGNQSDEGNEFSILINACEVLDKSKSTSFKVVFDKKSRHIIGWTSENISKNERYEFTVDEWSEIDCGNKSTINLPKRSTLNFYYAPKKPGTYEHWMRWSMEIVSAAFVEANPELFTIDPSTANSIYDQKLGQEFLIKKKTNK
jgi:hypothetical protein